ncbi:hypothetical protein VNO78_07593 [Psophocarpus tetragonolobus]|uniref:Uncharacterized protein n=1 Tax=Psophocarpus tetragonolobus TaxID=3891 RepID=A0AAN9XSW7_PSOTE
MTDLNFDFWTKNLDDMKDSVIDKHVCLTGTIDKSSKVFAKAMENNIPQKVGQNHAEINVVMVSDLVHIVPQVEQIDQTISSLSHAEMAGVLPHDAGKEVERSRQFDVLIVECSMFVSRVHAARGISCNNEEVERDKLQRVSKEDSCNSSLKLAGTRCRTIGKGNHNFRMQSVVKSGWNVAHRIGQSVSKVKPIGKKGVSHVNGDHVVLKLATIEERDRAESRVESKQKFNEGDKDGDD